MSQFRLPVRGRPYPDESASDYLRRIASLNGYVGSRQLFCGALSHIECTIENLAMLCGCTRDELSQADAPWPKWIGGSTIFQRSHIRTWINYQRQRWCPECLRDAPYMRSAWSFKLIVACPHHQVILRETCDRCGQTQPPSSAKFLACDCGRAFTDMSSEITDDSVANIMRFCYRKVPGRSAMDGPLARLSPLNMLKLMYALSAVIPGFAKSTPGILAGQHDLRVATRYVQQCAILLNDWPNGFRALLRSYLDREPETSIRRRFSPLYHVLYSVLDDRRYDFLRREFESHLNGHWYGSIDGRHRCFDRTLEAHNVAAGNEIRSTLRRSRQKLRHLIETGFLDGRVLKSPSGRSFLVAQRSNVLSAASRLNSSLSLRSASQQLCISKRRLRLLLDVNLIRHDPRCRVDGGSWMVPRDEIDRLSNLSINQDYIINESETWTMAHVLRHLCRANDTFLVVMRAVLSGQLRCVGRAVGMRGICAFLVDKAETKWVIANAGQLPSDGLTAQAVARRLAIKEEVAYHLIRSGILGSAKYRQNGRMLQLVSEANLHEFEERYVSLVSIAMRHATSTQAALSWLGKSGTRPITGPSIDGSRQYFFLRSDISAGLSTTSTCLQGHLFDVDSDAAGPLRMATEHVK
ncbi:tniQ family protein [Burkholderia cenocepacia]|nr:tniQ family protein [Burkholderia cenocepacia]